MMIPGMDLRAQAAMPVAVAIAGHVNVAATRKRVFGILACGTEREFLMLLVGRLPRLVMSTQLVHLGPVVLLPLLCQLDMAGVAQDQQTLAEIPMLEP